MDFFDNVLQNANVYHKDDMLMAIIPPAGSRPDLMSLIIYLKIAKGTDLIINRSELIFTDTEGNIVETRLNAFGLLNKHITGPYSKKTGDDNYMPKESVAVHWYLNEYRVQTSLLTLNDNPKVPKLVCLPLQVNLPDDYHFIITIINTTQDLLNIADEMRQAVCRMNEKSFPSIAGRLWNGGYLIRPGRAALLKFRLGDFLGAPKRGLYEVSMEICGLQSATQYVNWYGDT